MRRPDGVFVLMMDPPDFVSSRLPLREASEWFPQANRCHLPRFLQYTARATMDASASRSQSVSCELSPVCGRKISMAGSEVTLSPFWSVTTQRTVRPL